MTTPKKRRSPPFLVLLKAEQKNRELAKALEMERQKTMDLQAQVTHLTKAMTTLRRKANERALREEIERSRAV